MSRIPSLLCSCLLGIGVVALGGGPMPSRDAACALNRPRKENGDDPEDEA